MMAGYLLGGRRSLPSVMSSGCMMDTALSTIAEISVGPAKEEEEEGVGSADTVKGSNQRSCPSTWRRIIRMEIQRR